jgi:hypothetical protein
MMMRGIFTYFFPSIDGYLYVPFAREEQSDEFRQLVEDFQACAAGGDKSKNFAIIYYGQEGLSDIPNKSKIYVLGHGMEVAPDKKVMTLFADPSLPYNQLKALPFSDWAYAVTGGNQAISIDTVAKRMIEDGLLNVYEATIKLWFCDPNQKAEFIAKTFLSHFKDFRHAYRVDYYLSQMLHSPCLKDGSKHKWSVQADKKEIVVRASSVRSSLFSYQQPAIENFPEKRSTSAVKKRQSVLRSSSCNV